MERRHFRPPEYQHEILQPEMFEVLSDDGCSIRNDRFNLSEQSTYDPQWNSGESIDLRVPGFDGNGPQRAVPGPQLEDDLFVEANVGEPVDLDSLASKDSVKWIGKALNYKGTSQNHIHILVCKKY